MKYIVSDWYRSAYAPWILFRMRRHLRNLERHALELERLKRKGESLNRKADRISLWCNERPVFPLSPL